MGTRPDLRSHWVLTRSPWKDGSFLKTVLVQFLAGLPHFVVVLVAYFELPFHVLGWG